MKELQYLNKYLHKYRGRLLLGLVTTVIAAVFKLAIPMKVGDSITIVEQKINGKITDIATVEKELFIALNTSCFTDGVYIDVAKNTVIEKPIHIINITNSNNLISNTRTLVKAPEKFFC